MKRSFAIFLSIIMLLTAFYIPYTGVERAEAASQYSPGFTTFNLREDGAVKARWNASQNKLTIEGSGVIYAGRWKSLARKFDKKAYSYKKSDDKFVSWGNSYFTIEVKKGVRFPSNPVFEIVGGDSKFYSGFFHGFKGRVKLPSSIDTSNLTSMRAMFTRSGIQNLNMTSWDTSKVTSTYNLFGSRGNDDSTRLTRFEINKIPGSDNPDEKIAKNNIENFIWPEFLGSYVVDKLDDEGNVIYTSGPYRSTTKYDYQNGDHVVARIIYNSNVKAKLSRPKFNAKDKSVTIKWNTENKDSRYSGFQILRGCTPDQLEVIDAIYDRNATTYFDDTARTCRTYYYAVRPFIGESDMGLCGERSTYRTIYTVKMKKPKIYVKGGKVRLYIPKADWLKYASGIEIRKRRYPAKSYYKLRTLTKLDKSRYIRDDKTYHANYYTYWLRPYKLVDGKRIYGAGRVAGIKHFKPVKFKIKRNRWRKGAKLSWKGYKNVDGYYVYKWSYRNGRYVRLCTLSKKRKTFYDKKLSPRSKAYYKVHAYRIIDGKKLVSIKYADGKRPHINKYLSRYNQESRGGQKVRYIVIHYVGALGTAKQNCQYFARGDRQASAHFFVDSQIWQSIPLNKAAWHCGGGLQDLGTRYYGGNRGARLHGICRNKNSIGIELCCQRYNGRIVPTPKAIETAVPLVRYLMRTYNVPANRVIRHYDVTGKVCPNGYIAASDWAGLHKTLTGVSGRSYR